MPATPKRRWFQFRLRTLLIGVVVLAVPLGYVAHEAQIVRERDRLRDWLETNGVGFVCSHTSASMGPGPTPVPWLREQIGDQGEAWIAFTPKATPADEARVKAVFPEAELLKQQPDLSLAPIPATKS